MDVEQQLGAEVPLVAAAVAELVDKDAVARLWQPDPALWKPNPAEQQEIADRVGWLRLPESMQPHVPDLRRFADEVRQAGTRDVVLCGMGGSSLAPEVFRITFGSQPGYPTLHVLDSTSPDAVRVVDAAIDPTHTLFLISSKSGGTLEVMSFLAHFWELAGQRGQQFCAITDPGTSLEHLARERGFRRVFLNPPDIGGRYSALSLFGLVPAALIGMDLDRLLDTAANMQAACGADIAASSNPGAWLGAYMGGLARAGRDKLTLLTSPALESFGLWVEQLIAESTGKEGKGIVPVVGEPLGTPDAYGQDRSFVALRLEGDDNAALDDTLHALRGHTLLVVIPLNDRYDQGREMYRWEFATAISGALLGINPFDQPNVQESKDNTSRVLAEAQAAGGSVAAPPADVCIEAGDEGRIAAFLAQAAPGDYVAIQAYVHPTPEVDQRLQAFRAQVRDYLQVATTLGFGPRFLHSTGQLHKGGPARGLFLQLTSQPSQDLPIPGQPFSFGTLIAAQAAGDLQSLASRGLRVARVDLGADVLAGLDQLSQATEAFPRGV